ncbi:unnamed protein product, partial [Symbiodinium microadriaticum]
MTFRNGENRGEGIHRINGRRPFLAWIDRRFKSDFSNSLCFKQRRKRGRHVDLHHGYFISIKGPRIRLRMWKDEDVLSCHQLEKSRAELQEAARCQRIEEDQMQTTRATLQALQQRAHEAEEMRLQEQQRQREQLLEYKDGLRHLLGKLREEYDQDMATLKQVQEEEQKLEYEHKVTMVEVADLSELEEALAKLEEEQAMLQKERQRLM